MSSSTNITLPPLRILLINKFFYPFGGVESCVFEQMRLLTQLGHYVIPFGMSHHDNITTDWASYFVSEVNYKDGSIISRLRAAARSVYSVEAQRKISSLVTDSAPDIAHIHHIYNQISPSILYALKTHNIPIIQTIHDYKPICPNAKLYIPSQKEVCYDCKGHRYYNAIRHNCGSYGLTSSALIALEAYLDALFKPYLNNISYFITPSQFLKNKLLDAGYPAQKVEVVHNFIDTNSYSLSEPGREIVYIGRLDAYKGIDIFIEAARHLPSLNFKIAGKGPFEETLKKQASELNNVSFLGQLNKKQVKLLLSEAMCLVTPSIWHDIAPMVVLEAFASGRPVIATGMGGLAEMIPGHGLFVQPNDWEDLVMKINLLKSSSTMQRELGLAAHEYVNKEYTSDVYGAKISRVYQKVLSMQ